MIHEQAAIDKERNIFTVLKGTRVCEKPLVYYIENLLLDMKGSYGLSVGTNPLLKCLYRKKRLP